MIENIYKNTKKLVTCDNCGDGFEAESWEEAQEVMKRDGWKKKKVGDIYEYYCPECAEQKGVNMDIVAKKKEVYEYEREYYGTKEELLTGAIRRKLSALYNDQDIRYIIRRLAEDKEFRDKTIEILTMGIGEKL